MREHTGGSYSGNAIAEFEEAPGRLRVLRDMAKWLC